MKIAYGPESGIKNTIPQPEGCWGWRPRARGWHFRCYPSPKDPYGICVVLYYRLLSEKYWCQIPSTWRKNAIICENNEFFRQNDVIWCWNKKQFDFTEDCLVFWAAFSIKVIKYFEVCFWIQNLRRSFCWSFISPEIATRSSISNFAKLFPCIKNFVYKIVLFWGQVCTPRILEWLE